MRPSERAALAGGGGAAPTASEPAAEELVPIGCAAEAAGMTARTLRYYEEIGLVSSSRPTAGGTRRYSAADIERLKRIRELQTLLGLDLDQIAEQLKAADRLETLRAEYRAGPRPERRQQLLDEVLAILGPLRQRVVERQSRLAAFLEDLDERIARASARRDSEPQRAAPR